MASNFLGPRKPRLPRWTVYVLVLALTLALGVGWSAATADPDPAPKDVPLSQALAQVRDGGIVSAEINDGANTVVLTRTKAAGGKKIVADYPFTYSGKLTEELLKADVKTDTNPPEGRNVLVDLLATLLPILLILGFLYWLVKSGAMTGGIVQVLRQARRADRAGPHHYVRRRRRRRRGRRGAARAGRVPQGRAAVHPGRGEGAPRRAARRAARHRQDPAGPRGRRRGRSSLLCASRQRLC